MYANEYGGGGGGGNNGGAQKRVMVVVDETSRSKHAMMWALTHITNKGDWLTLLHIISDSDSHSNNNTTLASSLGSLCKACKPEVIFVFYFLLMLIFVKFTHFCLPCLWVDFQKYRVKLRS